MLTGYLKNGTEYLSASTVRRVVQVASMSVVGSAIAVSRLDKEVRRVTATYPEEDPITWADHMVRMCEEEVLDWMRTRTVHPGPDADPDPAGSPKGQELVDDLEKVLAEEEAERYPPPGSKEDAWMMKVLEQATKVHCFAEEICNETAREDWQLCAYQLYQWQMDQEVGHLYALFGGPQEDEVRVKGQRLAKTWMDKAVGSVERARRCVGLRFQGTSGLDKPRQCRHDGPPAASRPCEIQARTATRRADRAWRRGPRRVKELCGGLPGVQASQTGIQRRRRLRMAALSFHQDLQTVRATRTASSPVTPAPRTLRRTPRLREPSQRSPVHWKPDRRAPCRPGPYHRKLSLRTLTHPRPSQGSLTPSTWRQGEEVHSLLARATPILPPLPLIQRTQTRAASTQVLRNHPRRTPRRTLLPRHHLWKRPRNLAGR
jgi:hypothetical protein